MHSENETAHHSSRAPKPSFLTDIRFDDFDLPPEVKSGLSDAGFEFCTPIQAQTLPVALDGRDVAGQAQTGTGKTAAFLVTILSRLLRQPQPLNGQPSALIIAPTRELSHQIYEEALLLSSHTSLSAAEVVGGIDYRRQADILKRGVDIVICTPGRLIDYYKQRIFKPAHIRMVVIDEADRLLDLGFAKDMRYILRNLPPYDTRQSMLFSATLSYRVLELTYEYMNLPEFIAVTPQEVTVEGIQQQLFHVGRDKKVELLLGLLKREDWSRILIFVNTKIGVDRLTHKLKGNGWPAERITGDLPQRKRFQLMEQFKQGKIKILVATDVASRGIHVEDISHVINFDLPQDAEGYVHRIGRTARAGKSGKAFSLACEDYVYHLEPLEDMLGYKLPVLWPEDDWFEEDRSRPFKGDRRLRMKRSASRRQRSPGRQKSDRPQPKQKPERPQPKQKPERPRPKQKDKPQHVPGAFFGFGLQTIDGDPSDGDSSKKRSATGKGKRRRSSKPATPTKPSTERTNQK
jgi:ATP-dependent RNA helicase RhlB